MSMDKHKFSNKYMQFKKQIQKSVRSHQSSIQSKKQYSYFKSLNIYEFKDYQHKRLSSKAKISNQARRKIKYNQEISRMSSMNIKKRQLADDYLSRYKFNAFTAKSFKKYQVSKVSGSDRGSTKKKSTEHKMSQCQNLEHQHDQPNQRLDHQLKNKNKRIKQLLTRSAIWLNNITHKKQISFQKNNKPTIQQKQPKKIDNKSINYFTDLDSIISMDNIKYRSNSFQNFNIFQFRFLEHFELSYVRQFRKWNFCQNSIVTLTPMGKRLNIFQHIGTLVRKIIKNTSTAFDVQEVFDIPEIKINFKSIQLSQIFATANGWLNSEMVWKSNQVYQQSISEQSAQRQNLLTRNDELCKLINNAKQNNEFQIEYYKNIPFSNYELRHAMLMKQQQQAMKDVLKKQIKLQQKYIRDILVQDFQQQKKTILENHERIKDSIRTHIIEKNIERKIRQLKQKKDKIDNIGLKSILLSLKTKKQLQKIILKENKKKVLRLSIDKTK